MEGERSQFCVTFNKITFLFSNKALDAVYYITHVLIPPLARIFNLVGADIKAWYDEMPRTLRADEAERGATPFSPKKPRAESLGLRNDLPTIENHFRSSQCLICASTTCDGLSWFDPV